MKNFNNLVSIFLIVSIISMNAGVLASPVFAFEKGSVNLEKNGNNSLQKISKDDFHLKEESRLKNVTDKQVKTTLNKEETKSLGRFKGVENIDQENKNYVEGEVLVKFKERKINLEQYSGRVKASQFATNKSLDKKEDLRKINVSVLEIKDGKTVEEKIAELENNFNVEYAEPNYKRYPSMINTNDPYKDLLWGLDNIGQNINGISGTTDADVDSPEAWAVSDGSENEVIVAVIDSGVAYNHPDLQFNMWDGTACVDENNNVLGGCEYGYDYKDGDKTPLPTTSSHGTHIAGTIGAIKNNDKGIIGVAPNVKIMAIKFALDVATEIKSIDFAIHNGAKIINASFGGTSFSQSEYDAINRFKNMGGLFIAAAGNGDEYGDPNIGDDHDQSSISSYPCDYDSGNIICVAATDQNDEKVLWSDYGTISVDVGAPGVNIYSTTNDTDVLNETFEEITPPNIPTGWVKGGTPNYWGTYDFEDDFWGKVLYGDYSHISYENNIDSTLTLPTYNLSGSTGATIDFWTKCDTEYWTDTPDYMAIEVSGNGINFEEILRWDELLLDMFGGVVCGNSTVHHFSDIPIAKDYLTDDFKLRFKWFTDSSNIPDINYDGCVIDDIKVTKYTDGSDEQYAYGYMAGTSMAVPHVAGLAGLIWGYKPNLTYAEVKDVILTTGDDLSSLTGKTVTGKRINAYNALAALPHLTISKNCAFANQDATIGDIDVKIGSAVLVAGVTEGININHINVDISTDESILITNLRLENDQGNQLGSIVSTPSESNSFSIDYDIQPGESKVIDIYADVVALGLLNVDIAAEGIGLSSGWSVDTSMVTLQDINIEESFIGTEVSGNITEDTTWALENSPYIVTDTVQVLENIKLTIEPGVEIKFNQDTGLNVGGELNAIGTESEMIIFTSNQENPNMHDWNEINFTDSSVDAVVNGATYISGSIIENCRIEYAYRGIWINDSSPFISSNFFTNNENSLMLSNSNSVVFNNTIINSDKAVYLFGNSPIISSNTITDNIEAFEVATGCPDISKNTIKDNENGFSVCCSANPIIEYNNIINNGEDGKTLWSSQESDITAINNYWGVTDHLIIDNMIHDYYDNINLGEVIYEPFATAELDFNDETAPILSEVTPVPTPTNNSTPDYTFNSDEIGTIAYTGLCSSTTTIASIGDNTIIFNELTDDVYSDCAITVTDAIGNESLALQVSAFTIDTTPPEIYLNGDEIMNLTIGDAYDDPGATAFDDTDDELTASIVVGGDIVDTSIAETYVVTYNVSDSAGNPAIEVTRTVIVSEAIDETDPVISLIGDNPITIEVGTEYNDAGASAIDDVDGDISEFIITGGDTINVNVLGIYVITYNVSDIAGNEAIEVTRTVNVVDTTAPTVIVSSHAEGESTIISWEIRNDPWLNLNGVLVDVEIDDSPAWSASYGEATNNPHQISYGYNLSVGAHIVETTLTDQSENVAIFTETVDVVDSTVPIITLNGSNPVTIEVGVEYQDAGATATDDIDGDISESIVIAGDVVDTSTLEVYTITYNVSDNAGNPAAQVTRIVNVVDTTAPVITLLGNNPVTLEVGVTYNDAGATANDNYDGNITADIITINSVDSNIISEYIVTYNVIDSSENAAVEITRTVNVSDTTAPALTEIIPVADLANPNTNNSTPDYTFNSTEAGTISYSGGCASVITDAFAGDNIIIFNELDDGTYSECIITVTDAVGNESLPLEISSFTIDTVAPIVIITSPEDGLITNQSTITIEYTEDGNVCSRDEVLSEGENLIVIYGPEDVAGNRGEDSITVILDVTPPVITLLGDNPVNLYVGDSYEEAGATATDNIGITNDITIDNSAVDIGQAGTYEVMYSVSDIAGNPAVGVIRTVIVEQTSDQTEVSGIIAEDTIWTLENSPYIVTGNILVPENITLTIEPGVEVQFRKNIFPSEGYYIEINGTLVAEGTESQKILFTFLHEENLPSPGEPEEEMENQGWRGLRFKNCVDWNEQNQIGTILRHSIIEHVSGDSAINVLNCSPLFESNIIRFVDYQSICVSGESDNAKFFDNKIEDGVIMVASTSYFSGNEISGQGFDVAGGTPIITKNNIVNNQGGDYSGGIRISRGCPIITYNNIVNNSKNGIGILGLGDHYNMNERCFPTIEHNNIYDNETFSILVHNVSCDIDMPNNWWGTTNESLIDDSIYDSNDDFNLGTVNYNPFLIVPEPDTPDLVGVADTTSPVITLLGDEIVNIKEGDIYEDAGATALDNTDGDLTSSIVVEGPIDTSIIGTHTIIYNVSDAAGNPADEITRTVVVNEATAPIAYLAGPVAGDKTELVITFNEALHADTLAISDIAFLLSSILNDVTGTSTPILVAPEANSIVWDNSNTSAPIATISIPLTTFVEGQTLRINFIENTVKDLAENAILNITNVDTIVLASTQIAAAPTVMVDDAQTEVVITSDQSTSIMIPNSVTNATININSLITDDGTSATATLPETTLNVETSISTTPVEVSIPANAVVSALTGWNGVINAPKIESNSSVTITPDSGNTATVSSVIEIGYGDVELTFDKAVRLLIPGAAGKYVGYSRSGTFTQITTACSADTQTAGNALAVGGDCKINVGSDLIVWTKHFTKFATYTQTAIPSTTVVYSGGGGGGGGGGGYDRTAPAISKIEITTTDTEATITWKTNESSISWVVYGTSADYGSEEKTTIYTKSHSIKLSDLSPGDTYHYQIKSKDRNGNIAKYTDKSFIAREGSSDISVADINNDSKVDKYDFSMMMASWGKTGSNNSDLNNDDKVDKYDFALLMANWGAKEI